MLLLPNFIPVLLLLASEPNDFGLFRMSMNTQKNGRVTRYYFIHDINSTLTKAECAKFDTNPIDSMDSYPRTRNTTLFSLLHHLQEK